MDKEVQVEYLGWELFQGLIEELLVILIKMHHLEEAVTELVVAVCHNQEELKAAIKDINMEELEVVLEVELVEESAVVWVAVVCQALIHITLVLQLVNIIIKKIAKEHKVLSVQVEVE